MRAVRLVLAFLAGLMLASGTAFASTAAGEASGVRAVDLGEQPVAAGEVELTSDLHRSCQPTYDRLASDSLLAARGVRATAHGAKRLAEAGFTDDMVRLTRTEGKVLQQADGATVYLREASPGRFDFIVEGERGVVTAQRNWAQDAIDRIAGNYGWGPP